MSHMKTIAEIRLANLETLIAENVNANTVAELGETNPIYLSQIRNRAKDSKTGKHRQMGDDMARALERGCKKEVGWMDNTHHAAQPEATPGAAGPAGVYTLTPATDPRTAALLDTWASLDDTGKDDCLLAIRMFVAGRRPHQNGQALSVAGAR